MIMDVKVDNVDIFKIFLYSKNKLQSVLKIRDFLPTG
jgi:hypothetical protein